MGSQNLHGTYFTLAVSDVRQTDHRGITIDFADMKWRLNGMIEKLDHHQYLNNKFKLTHKRPDL